MWHGSNMAAGLNDLPGYVVPTMTSERNIHAGSRGTEEGGGMPENSSRHLPPGSATHGSMNQPSRPSSQVVSPMRMPYRGSPPNCAQITVKGSLRMIL